MISLSALNTIYQPTALKASADGRRIYGGFNSSDIQGRFIAVASLTRGSVSNVRWVASNVSLNGGTSMDINDIVLDEGAQKRKMYVVSGVSSGQAPAPILWVYDLDTSGYPTGLPRMYAVPGTGTSAAYSLALHPTLNKLYVGVQGGIYEYSLGNDSQGRGGEPQGSGTWLQNPTPGLFTRSLFVASAESGAKLYASFDSNRIAVINLDAGGSVLSSTSATFNNTPSDLWPNQAGGQCPGTNLRFIYTPQALYLRPTMLNQTIAGGPYYCQAAVWPLDAKGELVGSPQFQSNILSADVGIDPQRNLLWIPSSATQRDTFSPTSPAANVGVLLQGWAINVQTKTPQEVVRTSPSSLSENAIMMTVAQDGTPILLTQRSTSVPTVNLDRDWRIRVKLLALEQAGSPAPSGTQVSFDLRDPYLMMRGPGGIQAAYPPVPGGPLTVGGNPSSWLALDSLVRSTKPVYDPRDPPFLKDLSSVAVLGIGINGVNIQNEDLPGYNYTKMQLQIDLARGDPASGGTLLKSISGNVWGGILDIVIPGYAYRSDLNFSYDAADAIGAFETMAQRAERYRLAAREGKQAGPKPGSRPTQFVVSCRGMIGLEGSASMLDAFSSALADLGCNTVLPDTWGNISRQTVNQTVSSYGLIPSNSEGYYWIAQTNIANCNVSSAPAVRACYPGGVANRFDFQVPPGQLACWANNNKNTLQNFYGISPNKVTLFQFADEPGWSYVGRNCQNGQPGGGWMSLVANEPTYLSQFRSYLQSKTTDPNYFGASINTLVPTDPSDTRITQAVTSPSQLSLHHLAYWSARFFADAAASLSSNARQALQVVFPNPKLTTYVNWNSGVNQWYGNGSGWDDWFEYGRRGATLWTEDYFNDQYAFVWSFYGAVMNSASLGTGNFGGHLIPGYMRNIVPDGASYKVFSLIGHGAKTIEFYQFGPNLLNAAADGWSEAFYVYPRIAEATQRLGAAEKLLYPGRPARGSVAIQMSTSSSLWMPFPQQATAFVYEPFYLYLTLVHQGYTVDFVDDKDIEDNLRTRNYSTLYIIQPNVSFRAQQAIQQWVNAGGTLVALAGAGLADEYNAKRDGNGTQTSLLDSILGVQSTRSAIYTPFAFSGNWTTAFRTSANRSLTATLQVTSSSELPLLGTANEPLYGDVSTDLVATSARVLARITTGGRTVDAITLNNYGAGRAIAYAFYPGYEYYMTGSTNQTRGLPTGFEARRRQMAAAPIPSNSPNPVTVDQPMVEAIRLDSTNPLGTAIVLLNWSGAPITSLRVSVPNTASFQTLSSMESGSVSSSVSGSSRQITLPLKTVDVVSLEP